MVPKPKRFWFGMFECFIVLIRHKFDVSSVECGNIKKGRSIGVADFECYLQLAACSGHMQLQAACGWGLVAIF